MWMPHERHPVNLGHDGESSVDRSEAGPHQEAPGAMIVASVQAEVAPRLRISLRLCADRRQLLMVVRLHIPRAAHSQSVRADRRVLNQSTHVERREFDGLEMAPRTFAVESPSVLKSPMTDSARRVVVRITTAADRRGDAPPRHADRLGRLGPDGPLGDRERVPTRSRSATTGVTEMRRNAGPRARA